MNKPIILKSNIQKASRDLKLNFSRLDDAKYVVWWYCGITKNNRDNSQPLVLVGFRKLIGNNEFSNSMVFESVSLVLLSQLNIGTVWKNGVCVGKLVFKTRLFELDFKKEYWKYENFHQKKDGPFPMQIYPLKYERDVNWLVSFNLEEGKLVIPCLEFFTSSYGTSAEFRRCIGTYPWEDLVRERLYASYSVTETPGEWTVAIGKKLVDADAIPLAHLKYDPYTRKAVKSIYPQLETQFSHLESLAFIRVGPWHQKRVQLRVQGIEFDEGRSFLGLRITGLSHPESPKINLIKERSSKEEGDVNEDESIDIGQKKLADFSDLAPATSFLAPDRDVASLIINDSDFEVLGSYNPIVKHYTSKSSDAISVNSVPTSDIVGTVSGGDAYGTEKEIGGLGIHKKNTPTLESYGILRDMWNAALFFKNHYPHRISSVTWYSPETGFSHEIEPTLIAFEPYGVKDAPKDKTTRNWPYIDPHTSLLRGVLVVRIVIDGQQIYILEIQRRSQNRKNQQGSVVDSEEAFQGLVFQLNNQVGLDHWLAGVIIETRTVKGVLKKLIDYCPGKAACFRHNASSSDKVPCESAVRNALRKMGVDL